MIKRFFCLAILIVAAAVTFGCNSTDIEMPQSIKAPVGEDKPVCFLYDSQNPVLMQPKADDLIKIMNGRGIDVKTMDLANLDYYASLQKIDIQSFSGLIISLPYNFNVEKYLKDIHSTKFMILQFGGNYYSNDISVSINSEYTGYLVGKKTGELFIENGKHNPEIGFYSIESEWKKFEQGFIEGLGEVVPDALISNRQIISMGGDTLITNGDQDFSKLDGIVVFFCDSYAKGLPNNKDILQVRVGEEAENLGMENFEISLSIKKEKKLEEALNQFEEMLNGNQTNKSEFKYNSVFDFVIS